MYFLTIIYFNLIIIYKYFILFLFCSRSFEKESLKQLKFMKKDSAQPGTSKYVLDIDDSDNNDSDSTEHLETQIP